MAELQKKVEERVKRQQNIIPYIKNDNYGDFGDIDLQELNSLKQQKKYVQDSFNKSIRLLTQSCIPNMGFYTPGEGYNRQVSKSRAVSRRHLSQQTIFISIFKIYDFRTAHTPS